MHCLGLYAIRQVDPFFRIPYFCICPSKCHPLHNATWGACSPLPSPPSHHHWLHDWLCLQATITFFMCILYFRSGRYFRPSFYYRIYCIHVSSSSSSSSSSRRVVAKVVLHLLHRDDNRIGFFADLAYRASG